MPSQRFKGFTVFKGLDGIKRLGVWRVWRVWRVWSLLGQANGRLERP